jgi:hypothetical protein
METPSEFAFTCHPRRDLALHYAEGSAPAPVAPTAQPGRSNDQRTQDWIKLGGKVRTLMRFIWPALDHAANYAAVMSDIGYLVFSLASGAIVLGWFAFVMLAAASG